MTLTQIKKSNTLELIQNGSKLSPSSQQKLSIDTQDSFYKPIKQQGNLYISRLISENLGRVPTLLNIINIGKNTYRIASKIGKPGSFGQCHMGLLIKNSNNQNMPDYVAIKKFNDTTCQKAHTDPQNIEIREKNHTRKI